MKKLLFLIVLFAIMFVNNTVKAQIADGYATLSATTTTDTQTAYLVVTSPASITKNYAVSLTVVPATVSGTATVTAIPQGSADNSVWFDLESAATIVSSGTASNKVFVYPNAYLSYYRIKLGSTGTGTTTYTGKLGIKRQ